MYKVYAVCPYHQFAHILPIPALPLFSRLNSRLVPITPAPCPRVAPVMLPACQHHAIIMSPSDFCLSRYSPSELNPISIRHLAKCSNRYCSVWLRPSHTGACPHHAPGLLLSCFRVAPAMTPACPHHARTLPFNVIQKKHL